MFCKNCGTMIDDDSSFCKVCGISLQEKSIEYKTETNNVRKPTNSKSLIDGDKEYNQNKYINKKKKFYIIMWIVWVLFIGLCLLPYCGVDYSKSKDRVKQAINDEYGEYTGYLADEYLGDYYDFATKSMQTNTINGVSAYGLLIIFPSLAIMLALLKIGNEIKKHKQRSKIMGIFCLGLFSLIMLILILYERKVYSYENVFAILDHDMSWNDIYTTEFNGVQYDISVFKMFYNYELGYNLTLMMFIVFIITVILFIIVNNKYYSCRNKCMKMLTTNNGLFTYEDIKIHMKDMNFVVDDLIEEGMIEE